MKKNGFSLLEIIIAVFFVGVILVPFVSVIVFTVSANRYANHRLIAANLAQEGIEIVRNIRDSQMDWTAWYGRSAAEIDGDYSVQYASDNLSAFTDNPLKLNISGFYNYIAGASTLFSRKISLKKLSVNEIQVIATVSWKERGITQSVVTEDRLFNWQ